MEEKRTPSRLKEVDTAPTIGPTPHPHLTASTKSKHNKGPKTGKRREKQKEVYPQPIPTQRLSIGENKRDPKREYVSKNNRARRRASETE